MSAINRQTAAWGFGFSQTDRLCLDIADNQFGDDGDYAPDAWQNMRPY